MSQPGAELRVGIFTILGLVATVFAVFVVSPDLFNTSSSVEYHTVLKDAAGILPKTHVKTNGVNVGKVKDVVLEGNATRVTLDILDDVEIPVGSVIEVRTVGFLGDKFIEIRRTDDLSKGYIKAGELIPRAEDTTDLNEVISIIGKIAKDVKKVTANLADVLGSEKGKQSLGNIVANIEDVTFEAKEILQENRSDVRSLIANIEEFSGSLNEVLDDANKDKLNRIIANFDDSMVEVREATKNINLIAQKIEKGEGTIGRLVNDDETLEELEGTLKDIRKVLAPVTQVKLEVDYHGELRQDNSSQNYFHLNFHTRPGSYYVLGFTDVSETVRTTTTEDIELEDNTDGTKKKQVETIKERKALRFDAQIARRWHFAAVRFGLFESTGGIGSDFYAWDDRLRFTVEMFDFAGEDESQRKFAHLKAYASVLFYNHLYVLAGVDDPTAKDAEGKTKDPNYFFGAGVRFNDEDLKALFGLAAVATSP